MADFGAPAQSNYQVPDGLSTLGNLMGLKQKQQQMQATAAAIPGIQAQSQMSQQDAGQRTAAASFFKSFDLTKHVKDDGTLDLDSAMTSPELRATGDAAPGIIQGLVGIKNSQLEAKQRLVTLNAGTRDQFRQNVGGLASDPDVASGNNAGRGKVLDEIDRLSQGGPDEARIAQIYRPVIQNADPKKLPAILKDIQLQAVSAGQQAEATKPGGATVTTPGGNVGFVNANPNAPQPVGSQVGQAVPQGIGPQLTPLPTGQVGAVAPGGKSVSPLGGTNPTSPQMAAATGRATGVTERVEQAKVAANNTVGAQDALMRAKALLESPSTPKTGGNFESIRSLKNLLSSVGVDTQGADDMNTLTKNLARYEAARATQAGLGGTDAARELAHKGSPSTQLDNKALLGIVRQSLASEKAIASYAKVQSKTADPESLIKNENDFRNIPHLIEAHEYGMMRNSDEAAKFRQEHNISPEQMAAARAAIKEFDNR